MSVSVQKYVGPSSDGDYEIVTCEVIVRKGYGAVVGTQMEVFEGALSTYAERSPLYKDNWKRMGWLGALVRVRERSDRLWDALYKGDPDGGPINQMDDAYDMLNFVAFLIRGVTGEATREGEWW